MNMYRRMIQFDPDPPAAGGGATAPVLNDFVKALPADLQTEKSLHNMTDVATLAKGYVHAQKLIGTKRLPVPDGSWNESQWNEFYDGVGRPKTAADYVPPKIEGLELKTDDPRWKQTAETLYKAGLTQKQAEAVLTRYATDLVEGTKVANQARANQRAEAETTLKTEWGDKYDANLGLAKSVVSKFAEPAFMDYLNSPEGNDPRLIRALSKIGAAMLDDHSRGGSAADGLQVTDATRATQEIDRLKVDVDFMKAFRDKNNPGHKAAVTQWMNLHKIATPNKQVEPS